MPPDREYHPLEVVEVVNETPDARSFVLDIRPELAATFAYDAGQFCTFRATIDGESIVRSYSMSSSPVTGDPFTTTVKRVPGGRMSNWMNDALTPGASIEVMRPTGLFVLRESDAPIVAFAGGSGITPVISIIKTALVTTTRPIRLVYANRSADSVIFAGALEGMRLASEERLAIHHHLDAERGFLGPEQCAGLVGEYVDADIYLCGPGAYMDVVETGLAIAGVAPDHVFVERFVEPGPAPADPLVAAAATESLMVRIGRRRHVIPYHAGDTVLEAVRRAGLRPPSSCEAGNCGTCMAHLDKGSVTLRANNVLTPAEVEDGWVLTCQSIPTSREVVIDYDP
jgi:3-ketosteroid 9alpha-monooxygenase subunit B